MSSQVSAFQTAVYDLVADGKFFTATFTKKDGTVRTINGRTGVHKFTSGVGRKYDPKKKGLITVWETTGQYRTVNINTISRIAAHGVILDVKQFN